MYSYIIYAYVSIFLIVVRILDHSSEGLSQYWDMALTQLALGDFPNAYRSFDQLQTSSNWSKALYSYSAGVALYESMNLQQETIDLSRVTALLKDVPDQLQKIAGKSIPVEVSLHLQLRKEVDD